MFEMAIIRKNSGFTLLELTLVLAVISLMIGLGSDLVIKKQSVECTAQTSEQLAAIQLAIDGYASMNERLPRPADPSLGSNDPAFGTEIGSFSSPGGVALPGGGVAIGGLPHTTLSLPSSFAADCWNRKFTYAVSTALTSADPATGYRASAGSILLKAGTRAASSDLMSNGAYVVISHGANGIGGTPLSVSSTPPRWCDLTGGTEIDRENCDVSNGVFFDSVQKYGAVAENVYDDVLIFAGKSPTTTPAPLSNVYCWGRNHVGQLGNGTLNMAPVPRAITIPSGVSSFTSISVGSAHTCGLGNNGRAYCWGGNNGALGDGTIVSREIPTAVSMPSGTSSFISVEAGNHHTCGIANNGAAYCWGTNNWGEIGDGTQYANRLIPTAVNLPSGVSSFISISPKNNYTCGIGNNGRPYCWGRNHNGVLGDGTTATRLVPAAVTLPSGVTSFTSIITGEFHACGIGNNGRAYCWGRNDNGELGDGTTTGRRVPTLVNLPSGVSSFISITPGQFYTCGIGDNGSAYCWGRNLNGELGDGTTTQRSVPTLITLPSGASSFAALSPAIAYNCGLGSNSLPYCWGRNHRYQLGDGTLTDRFTPVAVAIPSGASLFTSVDTSLEHSCGITSSCLSDGASSGGNPANCCNGDSDGDGVCGGPVCNWTLAGQQCEAYGTYGPTEFCSNRHPSAQSECWVEIGGPGCGGSDVMVERYTSSCGSSPPCIADGQPSGGDPAACCNGDSDGNGTCGSQMACHPSFGVYFAYAADCTGAGDDVLVNCPTGEGADANYYGSNIAPAHCGSIPDPSAWAAAQCRPCS